MSNRYLQYDVSDNMFCLTGIFRMDVSDNLFTGAIMRLSLLAQGKTYNPSIGETEDILMWRVGVGDISRVWL